VVSDRGLKEVLVVDGFGTVIDLLPAFSGRIPLSSLSTTAGNLDFNTDICVSPIYMEKK
jgi:hypothetical protein